MNADDLQELYKQLRGSRAALMVLDVRALFLEKQYIKGHGLLLEARELYSESRTRLLRQDPGAQTKAKGKEAERQAKRLKRKQEKTREILKSFDELAAQLQKFCDREQQKQLTAASEVGESLEADADSPIAQSAGIASVSTAPVDVAVAVESCVARPTDLTDRFTVAFRQAHGDDQLKLVSQHFGFQAVATEGDIYANALYLIHSGDKSYLVRTLESPASNDEVKLADAIDDRPMKPLSTHAFLKLGKKRKMVLLMTSASQDEEAAGFGDDPASDDDLADAQSSQPELVVIDMGAFSQLLTSAQRSGIVPGADQIAHVRDREFRKGNYDLAFQTIDGLYAKFTASMNARSQKLIREDADISSGRTKMSPKDLQAKRASDRRQSQEIDRARRRFQVVLEGLRVLMNAE